MGGEMSCFSVRGPSFFLTKFLDTKDGIWRSEVVAMGRARLPRVR
jgi:hypothetical protein